MHIFSVPYSIAHARHGDYHMQSAFGSGPFQIKQFQVHLLPSYIYHKWVCTGAVGNVQNGNSNVVKSVRIGSNLIRVIISVQFRPGLRTVKDYAQYQCAKLNRKFLMTVSCVGCFVPTNFRLIKMGIITIAVFILVE